MSVGAQIVFIADVFLARGKRPVLRVVQLVSEVISLHACNFRVIKLGTVELAIDIIKRS